MCVCVCVCAVSEATGQVVASTQSGLTLVRQDSAAKMDYSNLSLTQAKRLEMDCQVKALELEKELESERTRLAELRKIHYKLAGASEGWDEVSEWECVCVCVCVTCAPPSAGTELTAPERHMYNSYDIFVSPFNCSIRCVCV